MAIPPRGDERVGRGDAEEEGGEKAWELVEGEGAIYGGENTMYLERR